jgi:diguanylate cyclase
VNQMTVIPDTHSGKKVPMQRALSRALMALAALVITVSLVTVFIAGAILLRGYARENLDHVAWQASYTSEVAVVFDDRAAAAEAVRNATGLEGVSAITVQDSRGTVMARVLREGYAEADLAPGWLDPAPATRDIVNNGTTIGRVTVHGETTGIGSLLLACLLGTIAAGLLAWGMMRLIERRLRRAIIEPLRAIADATHGVRDGTGQQRRAPRAEITEVDELSLDFNRLLAELEGWQAQVNTAHRTLLNRANHDQLSGLPNRSHFVDRAEVAIAEAKQAAHRCALFFLDGDGFKAINDQHGHAAGDQVIRELGARLQRYAHSRMVAARMGGDEFALLLPVLENDAKIDVILDEIAELVAPPITLSAGVTTPCSATVGYAVFPDDGKTVEALIKHADGAMYENKSAKRRALDQIS